MRTMAWPGACTRSRLPASSPGSPVPFYSLCAPGQHIDQDTLQTQFGCCSAKNGLDTNTKLVRIKLNDLISCDPLPIEGIFCKHAIQFLTAQAFHEDDASCSRHLGTGS